jgi:Na+/H+ antiporter NhaA
MICVCSYHRRPNQVVGTQSLWASQLLEGIGLTLTLLVASLVLSKISSFGTCPGGCL